MLSNVNNKALKMSYANGAMTSATVIDNSALPKGTSAKAIPRDASTFFASAAGNAPTLHNLSTGAKMDDWTGSVKPATVNVSGLAYFSLGGREFVVLPADIQGALATYDITSGLSKAAELLTTTTALGESANSTFTVDFAVRIDGNDAYVY